MGRKRLVHPSSRETGKKENNRKDLCSFKISVAAVRNYIFCNTRKKDCDFIASVLCKYIERTFVHFYLIFHRREYWALSLIFQLHFIYVCLHACIHMMSAWRQAATYIHSPHKGRTHITHGLQDSRARRHGSLILPYHATLDIGHRANFRKAA